MVKRMTKKEKAFRLFSEGKTASSPEVKDIGLKSNTRYSYYSLWKSEGGEIKRVTGTTVKAKASLLKGEKVGGISEVETKSKPTPEPALEPEPQPQPPPEPQPQPESKEEAPKTPVPSIELDLPREKPGKDGEEPVRKSIPSKIIGQGLPISVAVSVKTLYLYQLAANIEEGLTLGDFIDACVEDTYRGRGLELGIIKMGGKKDDK